jgi:hypothetical protein
LNKYSYLNNKIIGKMKMFKLSIITVIMSILTLSSLSGQIVTAIKPYSGDVVWDGIVSDFESSVSDLYTSHGSTQYQSFVFTGTSFLVDDDPIFNDSSPFGTYFRMVDNPDFFEFSGSLPVGFFGFEAGDNNKLGFDEYDSNGNLINSTQLFEHSLDTPPTSVLLNSIGLSKIAFTHDNPVKGEKTQDATERFLFFQSYDPFTLESGTEWIFAIDDREDSLIDFDDGFFYTANSNITPVPEPASIGLVALASIFGVMLIKRRMVSKKSS